MNILKCLLIKKKKRDLILEKNNKLRRKKIFCFFFRKVTSIELSLSTKNMIRLAMSQLKRKENRAIYSRLLQHTFTFGLYG